MNFPGARGGKMRKTNSVKINKNYRMVLMSIMVAVSVLLGEVTPFRLPFGGTVTLFSQVPIIAVSWIFGVKWGCFAGLALGIVEMILGIGNFSYVNGLGAYILLALLDYILPFTILGLGGMIKGKMKNGALEIAVGSVWVCVLRYACHFLSGIVLWNSNAPSKLISDIIKFSAAYNATYMVPETIITVIGAVIIERMILSKLDANGYYKGKGRKTDKNGSDKYGGFKGIKKNKADE